MGTTNIERRLSAILAADVVGYSRLIRADEEGTVIAFQRMRAELIEPLIAAHKGRVVKLMGDGILVEFASVVDAVKCGSEVQLSIAEHNAAVPEDRRLVFRIGINLGDVILEGDDIHGDGVNVAARLEALAVPGGMCASGAVHDQVRDRLDLIFEDMGNQELKNIGRAVRTWRWSPGINIAKPKVAAEMGKPSIAVLPFDNMSGDPEQEYFADGITEDIITEISKLPELIVISRNSTFTYKRKAAKTQDVCRDLSVRYVLEGSVRKAGQRVRITAQLIDGHSGAHLWAERYDRGLEDIFAVQDDVTHKIVLALHVKLVGAPEARRQTSSPEAYDCVLRGREQYRLYSKNSNAAARKLYKRAIAFDPGYAEAYAGFAETYVQDWLMGDQPALDRAFKLAQQAAHCDPSLTLVQEALSTVHLFKRQHLEAVKAARRGVELEPNNADGYATLASALHFSGDNEEVVALVEKAMRLNPFYPFYYPHYVGLANHSLQRYREAVSAFERSIALNPEVVWPHIFLASCYAHLRQSTQARGELAEVLRINPNFSTEWLLKFMPYRRSADLDQLIWGLRAAGLPT